MRETSEECARRARNAREAGDAPLHTHGSEGAWACHLVTHILGTRAMRLTCDESMLLQLPTHHFTPSSIQSSRQLCNYTCCTHGYFLHETGLEHFARECGASTMSLFCDVLDDDNLLRNIIALAPPKALSSARCVSSRLRAFATEEISRRVDIAFDSTEIAAFLSKLKIYCDHVHNRVRMQEETPKPSMTTELVSGPPDWRWQHRVDAGILRTLVCGLRPNMHALAVQSIALQRAAGIIGPHAIIVPTSSIELWQRTLQELAPSIPVIVNEGSPAERWNKLRAQSRSAGGTNVVSNFLWLSTYKLAVKDTTNLWKFLSATSLAIQSAWLDEGFTELRRGWKPGSPTHKFFSKLMSRSHVAVLSSSLGALGETDVAGLSWLMQQLHPTLFRHLDVHVDTLEGDRHRDIDRDTDLIHLGERELESMLCQFGVGHRDAPSIIEPLLRRTCSAVLERSPAVMRLAHLEA